MRLDHVFFAAQPGESLSKAQEIADRLGVPALDGGRHPRFGTKNALIQLADERWVEVVEPLPHPSCDKAPFGQAVKRRAENGGGWIGWVVHVDDMRHIERLLDRQAVEGSRQRADDTVVTWSQIGINGLLNDPQVPYFIHYDDPEQHPAHDPVEGATAASIKGLTIAGDVNRVRDWMGLTGEMGVDRDEWEPGIDFDFVAPNGTPGLLSVTFETPNGLVTI